MRRQLSSMLLCGAKTTMIMMAAAILAAPLVAQSAVAAKAAPKYPLDYYERMPMFASPAP